MNDFSELLYVTGLLNEEPNIDEGNYMLKGMRIQTLAREKQKRIYNLNHDLTVRFEDLHIRTLHYSHDVAYKQVKSAIQRAIKRRSSSIHSKEELLSNILPMFNELLKGMPNVHISVSNSSSYYQLACDVSKTKLIMEIDIYGTIYYIPLNPQKKFSDAQYHYRSARNIKANMIHLETIYLYLYVIYNLNQLSIYYNDKVMLESTLRGYATMQASSLLRQSWFLKGLPEWFNVFLKSNGYTETSPGDILALADSQKSALEYPAEDWSKTFEPLISYAYQEKPITDSVFLPSLYSSNQLKNITCFGIHVLSYLLKNSQEISQNYIESKKQHHTATVYMTKQNIPCKILHAMKSSPLNRYFDFVEFDASVDLESIPAITQEFILINQKFFSDTKYSKKCIRFRKLGRHKAAGLYFPVLGTLAVDIRSPESLIHELFHLIDDLLGNLSCDYAFSKIATRYQSCLVQTIQQDEANGILHVKKTGKYNLNYYLKRTEIFARCGEIYLIRIKKIKTSLLKQESNLDFAYPNDALLNNMIDSYYSTLLATLKDRQVENEEEKSEKDLCIANK